MFDSEFLRFTERKLEMLECLLAATHGLSMRALKAGDLDSYNQLSCDYRRYRDEDTQLRIERSKEVDRLTEI